MVEQVRREDQLRINEFGRNNAQLHELREQKKALKVRARSRVQITIYLQEPTLWTSQDKLDTLDDANTELMMGEGDNVELFIGESFIEASEESAQEYIEKLVEETNAKIKKLSGEEAQLETRQTVSPAV